MTPRLRLPVFAGLPPSLPPGLLSSVLPGLLRLLQGRALTLSLALAPTLTLSLAAAAEPAAAPTPSAGVTFYVAPVNAAGYVDYAAAVNAELRGLAGLAGGDGAGPAAVAADDNVFVGLLEQTDTDDWDPAHLLGLAEALGDFFVPLPERPFTGIDRFARQAGLPPDQAVAELSHADGPQGDPVAAPTTPPTTAPAVAAWLAAMSPALDGVSAALRDRAVFYAPLVRLREEDLLVHALLPHHAVLGSLAQALDLRSRSRLAGGDVDAAVDDLLALRRLARHLTHGPVVLDGLTGRAFGRRADGLLGRLYADPRFTRSHFDRLAAARLPDVAPLDAAVRRHARAAVLDAATCAARFPASVTLTSAAFDAPEEDIALWEAIGRVVSDPRFDLPGLLAQVNFLYDEMPQRDAGETLAAYAQRVQRYESLLERRGPTRRELDRLGRHSGPQASEGDFRVAEAAVFKMLTSLPILGDADALLDAQTFAAQGVVVSLAAVVQDFSLGRGHAPATLDELTPGYIAALPPDPGDGGAMRYRPEPGGQGFTLYSVGPNGVDDGGAADDLVFRVGP